MIAGCLLAGMLALLLFLKSYEASLTETKTRLLTLKPKIVQIIRNKNLADEANDRVNKIISQRYSSGPSSVYILKALDEMQGRYKKGLQTTFSDFQAGKEGLEFPLEITFNGNFSEIAEFTVYLENLRFPFYVIKEFTLKKEKSSILACNIKGRFVFPELSPKTGATDAGKGNLHAGKAQRVYSEQ